MLSETIQDIGTESSEPVLDIAPVECYIVISVSIDESTYEVALSGSGIKLSMSGMSPDIYMPLSDVVPQMLVPSDTTRQCPKLGLIRYYHLELWGTQFKDIAWTCIPEAALGHPLAQLNNLVAFDSSRVIVAEM